MSVDPRIAELNALLCRVAARHSPVGFASSLGAEDMVLTDVIAKNALPIGIFTLDTGRLPAETYELIDRVRAQYGLPIDVHCPDARTLEAYVRIHGVNGFYRSRELRERCCAIRKAAPLARALAICGAWITGQRRAQSVTRRDLAIEEFDVQHNLPKFNPLADWAEAEVWEYISANNVPTNALHARGFPSIGCAPCTRAIEPGEDIRAGRWWWEDPQQRECGLHRRPFDVVPIVPAAAVS
jgi:phosphoadenosine phosphosulfate reductase